MLLSILQWCGVITTVGDFTGQEKHVAIQVSVNIKRSFKKPQLIVQKTCAEMANPKVSNYTSYM